MCFEVHLCDDFSSFSGLPTTDREKPKCVKFVDRMKKFADFQEKWGHDFRQIVYKSRFGMCLFFGTVSGVIFVIVEVILEFIFER